MSLLAHDAARSAQSEDDVQFEAAVPMSIDEYLIAIGEFGRYQQRHYALVAGAWLPIGLTTLSMVFINARPRWLRDGVQFAGPPPCNATVVLVDQTVGGEFGLICDDAVLRADLNTLYFAGFLWRIDSGLVLRSPWPTQSVLRRVRTGIRVYILQRAGAHVCGVRALPRDRWDWGRWPCHIVLRSCD